MPAIPYLELPNNEGGNCIATTADDKLVVAGRSQITGSGADLLVARFGPSSGLLVGEGPEQRDALRVVPCPAGETFTILGVEADASNGVLEVFDPSGRQVHVGYHFTAQGVQVEAASLPPGLYVAYLRTKDSTQTTRFEKL